MLKRFFGQSDDADKGVAFLEGFLPGSAWVLAAIGGKGEVRSFTPATYGQAAPWIAKQLAARRSVRVMLGAPFHALTTSPTLADMRQALALGIEIAATRKPIVDAFERPPAIWIRGPQSLIAVWRFMNGVHPDLAAKAEMKLAERFQARRLSFFMPLPNVGDFVLLEFDKSRFVVPTDFDLREIAAPKPSREPRGDKPASLLEIEARPVEWLWPQVIPTGKLTLLGGLPGLGKSQVTVSMAAIISRGERWPASDEKALRGNVLLLVSEDGIADTVKPRLQAAGADMRRVFATDEQFDLAEDLEKLKALAEKIGELRLIVLDPISRYLAGGSPAKTRAALDAFMSWAGRNGIAVIGIRHPPKGKTANAQNLFGGTAEEIRFARGAWIALPDQAAPGRALLLLAKSNLISDKRGFAYRIEGATLPGGIETSRVAWEAERIEGTADDYLAGGVAAPEKESGARERANGHCEAGPEPAPKSNVVGFPSAPRRQRNTKAEDAAAWLSRQLANGPLSGSEVKRRARCEGFSIGTIYAAGETIGVVIEPGATITDSKTWRLP
ncbi:MAG: AAA family ATPase [Rhodomicrobium sp.]